jgi:hypothetical protein
MLEDAVPAQGLARRSCPGGSGRVPRVVHKAGDEPVGKPVARRAKRPLAHDLPQDDPAGT